MNRICLTLLLVLLGLIASLFLLPPDASRISAIIALVALLVSLTVSAFKNELTPFKLALVVDEATLVPTLKEPLHHADLIISLQFVNDGHGSGVIEDISIKVKGNGTTKLYSPINEIISNHFSDEPQKFNHESITGPFSPFAVHSNKSIKKSILFYQKDEATNTPLNDWSEGSYNFKIYIKHTCRLKFIEYAELDRFIGSKITSSFVDNTNH
ncbi:MAG: hypothetical protein L3J22_00940 [Xanthomonadales bacterium]|nr:hypothetical protein [Xanthomonadales bacterium]